MHAGRFRLYSSWPNYRDMLTMQWIKAPLSLEGEVLASISFVEQSRLSHLLGCKCFIPGITRGHNDNLASMISITDSLIDTWSQEACTTAGSCVSKMDDLITKMSVATGDGSLSTAKEVISMIKSVFELMAGDDVGPLVELCRNDKTFISTWGMPNHHAIFQRTSITL